MSGAISINNSNLSDWTKYTPLLSNTSTTISTANTWNTILNINGVGYLKKASIYINSTIYYGYIRVTIDGTVVYYASNSNQIGGSLFTLDNLKYNSTTALSYVCNPFNSGGLTQTTINYLVGYPYTGGSSYSCLIPKEIYFKTSLKIEIQTSTSNSVTINTEIEGGVH